MRLQAFSYLLVCNTNSTLESTGKSSLSVKYTLSSKLAWQLNSLLLLYYHFYFAIYKKNIQQSTMKNDLKCTCLNENISTLKYINHVENIFCSRHKTHISKKYMWRTNYNTLAFLHLVRIVNQLYIHTLYTTYLVNYWTLEITSTLAFTVYYVRLDCIVYFITALKQFQLKYALSLEFTILAKNHL